MPEHQTDPVHEHRYTYPTVIALPTRFDDHLPARCAQHAQRRHPAPCGACMRAQQERLRAHYEASVAAAQAWRSQEVPLGASAFSS